VFLQFPSPRFIPLNPPRSSPALIQHSPSFFPVFLFFPPESFSFFPLRTTPPPSAPPASPAPQFRVDHLGRQPVWFFSPSLISIPPSYTHDSFDLNQAGGSRHLLMPLFPWFSLTVRARFFDDPPLFSPILMHRFLPRLPREPSLPPPYFFSFPHRQKQTPPWGALLNNHIPRKFMSA